jgi:hypothetical protein
VMKRGRKSAAELAVVVTPLQAMRPPPPAELTEEQAEEWRSIVSRMPADWFCREHYAMLCTYCRDVVRERMLSHQIDAFKPEWVRASGGAEKLDKLLAMAERETRAVLALARSMRLTHQSKYKSKIEATRAGLASRHIFAEGRFPWEGAE